ncbi:hypothetical protein ACHMW7_07410 [Aminobacter sp. UC22_36]
MASRQDARSIAVHLYGRAEARPGREMGHSPGCCRAAEGQH